MAEEGGGLLNCKDAHGRDKLLMIELDGKRCPLDPMLTAESRVWRNSSTQCH